MKIKFSIIFIIILGVCFYSAGCGSKTVEQEDKDMQEVGSKEGAQQKLLTFSLSGTEKGKKKWDIEGESADLLSSEIVKLANVKGKTYNEDNVITITADKGAFDKKSNDVQLNSNVVAVTDDGVTLTTDHLNWNAKKEEVWTEDFVEVDRENVKAKGTGVKGHPALEKVRFEQDVTIDIAPSTVVTCDGPLEIDYQKSVAYLNKNVVVIDERGELKADKASVYFNKEKKEIKKVVAEGNVSIKRGDNVTYSDKAIYYADEAKVVLKGKPKVIIYSSVEEEKNGFNKN
jgi:LPS export ABC transporter protein LptC